MIEYSYNDFSQTENVGCGTGTSFVNYQKEDGCVGPPQPWNEIKLADVPDMQYFGKDGKGEVCFRGDNVMQGKVIQIFSSIKRGRLLQRPGKDGGNHRRRRLAPHRRHRTVDGKWNN